MKTHEYQELWDRMLIQAWHANANLYMLCWQFISEIGLEGSPYDHQQIFADMLRVPYEGRLQVNHGMSTLVRAFVHDHLPKISDWLWDGKSDELLLQKILHSGYDTAQYARRQSKLRRHIKYNKGYFKKVKPLSTSKRSGQWQITKGVRSK